MNNKYICNLIPLLPLFTVCLLATLFQLIAGSVPLAYDRTAILQGEWWRLITGGWLHHNLNHLLMNLAAWIFICLLLPQRLAGYRSVWLLMLQVALVDTFLFALLPTTHYYWGLSGALHGLFAISALLMIQERERQGWWWLLGLFAKLGWDLWRTDSVTTELIGTRVHVESHVIGAISGILTGLLLLLWYRRAAKEPTTPSAQ